MRSTHDIMDRIRNGCTHIYKDYRVLSNIRIPSVAQLNLDQQPPSNQSSQLAVPKVVTRSLRLAVSVSDSATGLPFETRGSSRWQRKATRFVCRVLMR